MTSPSSPEVLTLELPAARDRIAFELYRRACSGQALHRIRETWSWAPPSVKRQWEQEAEDLLRAAAGT
jgi:hypothetical protein